MTAEHPAGRPRTAGPPSPTADSPSPKGSDASLRVQILATEHWSLLATRSLSWSESFARANMFLTVLTGTVVALALVAQATDFGQPFVVFALLLLPVVLFIGLTTFVRLGEVNEEDLVWVRGMNRIRRAYLDIDPEIEPIFITGSTDDLDGVMRTYGSHETPRLRETFTHALVTTPATVAFVDCVIAAVLVGLVAAQLGVGMEGSALAAVGGFAVLFAGIAVYSTRKGMDVWVEGKVANSERE